MKRFFVFLFLISAAFGFELKCPPKVYSSSLASYDIGEEALKANYNGGFLCRPLKMVVTDKDLGNTAFAASYSEINSSGEYEIYYEKQVISYVNPFTGEYKCEYFRNDDSEPIMTCEYQNTSIKHYFSNILTKVSNTFFNTDVTEFNGLVDLLITDDDTLKSSVKKSFESLVNLSENANKLDISSIYSSIQALVKDYVDGNADDRVYNFSTFVGGLITLDPSVVEGYNALNGKLKISSFWKEKAKAAGVADESIIENVKSTFDTIISSLKSASAKSVISALKAFFTGEDKEESAKSATSEKPFLYKDVSKYEVSSWTDIFELKLWGFYYDLMAKFDIAYGYLINYLLFLTAGAFGFGAFAKGLMNKYLEKRATPGASEFWSKFAVVLLSVGVFYVSPSSINTDEDTGAPEFRYNQTLMKNFIRNIAYEGSRFATTFADVGLASYLKYIAHKENILNIKNLKDEYLYSVGVPVVKRYALKPIVDECLKEWGYESLDALLKADPKSAVLNKDYTLVSDFLGANKANFMDFNFCKEAAGSFIFNSYGAYTNALSTEEEAKGITEATVNAAKVVIANYVLLERKFGWVNVFSVPFSYFFYKNAEVFASPGIDYNKIKEKAENYLKLSGESEYEDGGIHPLNIMSKGIGDVLGGASALTMYNILPGFTDTYRTVKDFLMGLFGYTAKAYKEKSKWKNSKVFKLIKNVVKRFSSFVAGNPIVGKIFSVVFNSTTGYLAIMAVSIYIAFVIWNIFLTIIFLSIISSVILLKIVMYFADLLFYFVISTFVVLWAFSTRSTEIIKNYLKKGLVLLVTPTLIVFTSYIFIFLYEILNVIYIYLANSFLDVQKISYEALYVASDDIVGGGYITLSIVQSFLNIIIKLFGIFLAYITIFKGTDWILESFGLDNVKTISSSTTQEIAQKGERYVNPLS